jgi:hypothetical protein
LDLFVSPELVTVDDPNEIEVAAGLTSPTKLTALTVHIDVPGLSATNASLADL